MRTMFFWVVTSGYSYFPAEVSGQRIQEVYSNAEGRGSQYTACLCDVTNIYL